MKISLIENLNQDLNEVEVNILNLYEIKNRVLGNLARDFETIGILNFGENTRKTNTWFRNMDDYESHINSIDEGFDSKDAFFIGNIRKVKTPEYIIVKRSNRLLDVILNKELLKIMEITVSHQQKCIVFSKV